MNKVLALKPAEKARLIDRLLASLDTRDEKMDTVWANEAEKRIDAYESGELRAVNLKQVLEKYGKQ
jgi:putative addiction module component (TIGR02574 family)